MSPWCDSRTRRLMWAEFVVGSRPYSERFFFGYSGGCATANSHLFIYIYMYFLIYFISVYLMGVGRMRVELRVASCSCES